MTHDALLSIVRDPNAAVDQHKDNLLNESFDRYPSKFGGSKMAKKDINADGTEGNDVVGTVLIEVGHF